LCSRCGRTHFLVVHTASSEARKSARKFANLSILAHSGVSLQLFVARISAQNALSACRVLRLCDAEPSCTRGRAFHACAWHCTSAPPDACPGNQKGPQPKLRPFFESRSKRSYLLILVTVPAPTVRPPSRIAKRRPSSIAIGWMSSTVISVVSPGITISVPAGRVITPVTSVVRK
jgi:hypothetical protein